MEIVIEKQNFFKSMKGKLALTTATLSAMYLAIANPVDADDSKATEALKNAGITETDITGDGADSFMGSMTDLVYIIMGVGALWAVAWIIIGGMLLAGSGSNPQKRSGGLVAIAVAAVGIYIIYKAYTIAGWAAAL